MNILFITQYFPPETGAAPERAMGFAKYLTRAGHRVQVVSGLPNHPASSIHSKYRGKWLVRENFLGISVMRTYTYANPKKRLHHRLLNFFSFGFSSLNALSLTETFDALVLSIPPIFSVPSGFLIARLKGIPLVLDVRDLWPQAATSLGELKSNVTARLLEDLMNTCYRKSNQIAVVTRGILDALSEAGIAQEKIHLITNGVDNEIYHLGSEERGREVFRALGCEDKFIVLYAGVVGIIHGPWVIGETARLLKDRHDIAFVVIGDGVKKAQLEEQKLKHGLDNLYLLGNMQPSSLLPYLQGADLGLSTLQNTSFCAGTIPVKIFSYMACGLPVVFAGQGEGRQIVHDSGAGVCLEAEDPGGLSTVILELKNDPEWRRSMGKRGMQAVSKRFSRQALTESLESVIQLAIQN